MKFDGRVALGLDEFMLRLGHLKILISILQRTYGNRARIARSLAESLTKPVAVSENEFADLTEYLVKKRLCATRRVDGSVGAPHPKARYAHLELALDSAGHAVGLPPNEPPLVVWYQDLAISNHLTRSKVGAVTADTREISNKSGVSHLVDWAAILGIANRRLALTAVGRALGAVLQELADAPGNGEYNPYVIDHERAAFAWLLFAIDGDVLSRVVMRAARVDSLGKADAIELLRDVAEELRHDVAANRASASMTAVRVVRDFQEDLGVATRGATRREASSSTVWHRASSRFESLTDIGFLQKVDSSGVSRQYEYYYRPTETLRLAAETLGDAQSPSDWLDKQLTEVLGATQQLRLIVQSPIGHVLTRALRLSLGPTGVHIDSFAFTAATLAFASGSILSFASARERLVRAAKEHPEALSLSRGYSGTRAEFASVVATKFDWSGDSVFTC